ncbi:hypothetical protein L3V82_01995 [Thiotrichales bacterium 19S3-7]|nr:hypothetical protein [Thiotrichales bacterium 19S3-7]MCF6800937.1 hypothetical protein [Thiotrichales bacterium 19S3-11]
MPQNLTKVDNKGQGNCGYYAYAISFMYYLKQTGGKITDYKDAIGLDEQNCTDLQKIIENKNQEEITSDELQTIQGILGPKLRAITAERTQLEFIASPADSAIHHALNFKLRQKVKEILAETHPKHADLIEVATDRQAADYDSAELFKVDGLTSKIEEHAKVLADRFKAVKDPTKVNIDGFFSENTTKFFTENDNENLNIYTNHIAKNGVWAQEEQLTTLHRQITGETSYRDPRTSKIEVSRDREIPLAIYKDGKNASGSFGNSHSGIILNNQSNTHWTSLAFTSQKDYQKQSDYETNYLKPAQQREKTAEKLDISGKLDSLVSETENAELKSLYNLAKNEISTDKTHQVACLFFDRFKEIEQGKAHLADLEL